jgi:hypothetical protein
MVGSQGGLYEINLSHLIVQSPRFCGPSPELSELVFLVVFVVSVLSV